jgi:predicted oxidoreductase
LPESLATLELQRSSVLTRILERGDFRSGSITAIHGRCGKPNCHCHQPNQPGHGPNFRLTRKKNGKTVSESFSSAAELRKAQREVEAFHRFRQLSQELLEVNEKICRARPVADALSPEEKKRQKPSSRKSRAK